MFTILTTKLDPEGSRKIKGHNLGQNPTAHLRLKGIVLGQNCSSHACARIKGLGTTPFGGGKGAGKPKAERATRKRNKLPFAMPYSDGAKSPIR